MINLPAPSRKASLQYEQLPNSKMLSDLLCLIMTTFHSVICKYFAPVKFFRTDHLFRSSLLFFSEFYCSSSTIIFIENPDLLWKGAFTLILP